MSKTIDCPKCGEPMDVPAYPGDGVYKVHVCVEWPNAWTPSKGHLSHGKRLLEDNDDSDLSDL